ncbi:hypothetical protein LMOSLCC2482_1344 [Listeria monocytogenes serotype 7 str. SLCC2482]|nr:hypothetical protein LMOSLCC2482_1344 [Listeria monocytogenes serotype 7 str. SLCC2482]
MYHEKGFLKIVKMIFSRKKAQILERFTLFSNFNYLSCQSAGSLASLI